VNHNAEEMTPPRQNIFDKSKKSCLYERKENKLRTKITTQTRHIEKSCDFIIPEKPSKHRGVGFCYRKYPDDANEAQSRDMIKGGSNRKKRYMKRIHATTKIRAVTMY